MLQANESDQSCICAFIKLITQVCATKFYTQLKLTSIGKAGLSAIVHALCHCVQHEFFYLQLACMQVLFLLPMTRTTSDENAPGPRRPEPRKTKQKIRATQEQNASTTFIAFSANYNYNCQHYPEIGCLQLHQLTT